MRILILCTLFFIANAGYAQNYILESTLQEYGTNLKPVKSWTDDEYIVMLTKGSVKNKLSYVCFLIHPDRGIVSNHVISESALTTFNLISSNENEITVFYKAVEGVKSVYYALSFSKQSASVNAAVVDKEIADINKESIFSFVKDKRLLFASASKDKTTFAFRELTNAGVANIVYSFPLNDTLRKYLDNVYTSYSFKKYFRKVYTDESSVKMIVYNLRSAKLQVNVVDFNLLKQEFTIKTYAPGDKYTSYDASLTGNYLFLIKTGSSIVNSVSYNEFHLDVLHYPSMKVVKTYKVDRFTPTIAFQNSPLYELTYKEGLYFNGNYKFRDHQNDASPKQAVIESLSDGEVFINAEKTVTGNYALQIGSYEEVLITNTIVTTICTIYGILGKDLEPAKGSDESHPHEGVLDYLKSVDAENPEYTRLGYKNEYLVTYFKKRKEIVVQQF